MVSYSPAGKDRSMGGFYGCDGKFEHDRGNPESESFLAAGCRAVMLVAALGVASGFGMWRLLNWYDVGPSEAGGLGFVVGVLIAVGLAVVVGTDLSNRMERKELR